MDVKVYYRGAPLSKQPKKRHLHRIDVADVVHPSGAIALVESDLIMSGEAYIYPIVAVVQGGKP